jgi:hypothetical protein
VVSQGVGLATGLQSKFDWGAVAMAGIGGAIGAGLAPGGLSGQAGAFGDFTGSTIANMALRGATADLATQSIGVATGLQSKFDWGGVAAAGIGAGVMTAVGGSLASANPNWSSTAFALSAAWPATSPTRPRAL